MQQILLFTPWKIIKLGVALHFFSGTQIVFNLKNGQSEIIGLLHAIINFIMMLLWSSLRWSFVFLWRKEKKLISISLSLYSIITKSNCPLVGVHKERFFGSNAVQSTPFSVLSDVQRKQMGNCLTYALFFAFLKNLCKLVWPLQNKNRVLPKYPLFL